jgi:hypothetical protein
LETKELVSFEQGLIDPPIGSLITLTKQLDISIVEFTKEVDALQTEIIRYKTNNLILDIKNRTLVGGFLIINFFISNILSK